MIDLLGIERIEETLKHFAEGNPLSVEIPLAEEIWFSFDQPFQRDLEEYILPVSVTIGNTSPHNYGEPVANTLEDYGPEMYEDLVAHLDEALYNGGSRHGQLDLHYSPRNSEPLNGSYVFMGTIENPRQPQA